MVLPGCVMDDWWNHNGVTSYCGLFNQQVNYLKVCVCRGMVGLVKSPWCDYILGIVQPRGEMFAVVCEGRW